jgi:drug/metabolite transporter (DMT)-like permease
LQVSTKCDAAGNAVSNPLTAPLAGYLFALLSAFLSGFAAVYTEFVMKARDDSLYWQNMQLYAFGAVFNAAALTIADLTNQGSKDGARHCCALATASLLSSPFVVRAAR